MAWLTGWNRRKSKIISGSTTVQANYQMQLTVHKGTGTDTSTDIYLGTNVRDDFGDVRFTSSNGSTPLDYWVQSYVSGSVATFWIEVSSIPTGTNSATIYVYYDNPSQTTTGDGTNTFEFFDDFSGDLSKWNANRGSPSISVGELTLLDAATLISKTVHSYPVALETRAKYTTDVSGIGMVANSFLAVDLWSDNNQISAYSPVGYQSSKDGTTYSEISVGPVFDLGAYHIWKMTWTGSAFGFYKDGTLVNNKTTNIPTTNLYAGFSSYRASPQSKIMADWIFVRKYTSPEPTWSCSGGEEVSVVSWLTGWNRRRSKIINGSASGAQINYQMRFTVHKSTGTDGSPNPYDIYLGTNVRDDFGDVRFTKQDGSTLLNYWIDPSTLISGTSADIWIKIDSIPANPCTTTIYIYYDNPSQITTGNGTNTFDLFDDFSGTTLDATKWASVTGPSGGTITVGGGILNIYTPAVLNSGGRVRSANTFILPYAFRIRAKDDNTQTYMFSSWGISDANTRFAIAVGEDVFGNNGNTISNTYTNGYTSNAGLHTTVPITRNTDWHIYDILGTSSGVSYYQDGTLKGTATTNIPTTAINFTIKTMTHDAFAPSSAWNTSVDYLYLRKYSSPEPTFGASGAEELPAFITATGMTIVTSQTPCLQGICTVTVEVTWTNQGTATGSFVPSLTIDGTPITSPYSSENLNAGASVTHAFDITNLAVGDRAICPSPN